MKSVDKQENFFPTSILTYLLLKWKKKNKGKFSGKADFVFPVENISFSSF